MSIRFHLLRLILITVVITPDSSVVAAPILNVSGVLPRTSQAVVQKKESALSLESLANIVKSKQTATILLNDVQGPSQIIMKGTVDGYNSYTRKRVVDQLSGQQRFFDQKFQPMTLVRMTNVGSQPVVNPILKINNQGMARSLGELSLAITSSADGWEEKTKLLWQFLRTYRYANYPVIGTTGMSPLPLINSTGSGYCTTWAVVLEAMVDSIGGTSRTIGLNGHVVTEIYYQGEYHIFDPHYEYFFLDHDNSKVVSAEKVLTDRALLKRTASTPSRAGYYCAADLVEYELAPEAIRILDNYYNASKKYNFFLAPAASLQFFDNIQRPRRSRTLPESTYFDPSLVGLVETPLTETGPVELTAPSFLIGADLHLEVSEGTSVHWAVSLDGKRWTPQEELTTGSHIISLDEWIDKDSEPEIYRFFLDIQGKNIQGKVLSYFQVARQVLPALRLGTNVVEIEADSPYEIEVQCEWEETWFTQPPLPVTLPVFPEDGKCLLLPPESLSWYAPNDPDGDAIVDYEVIVSDDPQCRWPLAPQFNPLLSLTSNKGTQHFDFDPSFFKSNTTYFWKVRAQEENGIWSNWSHIFTFSSTSTITAKTRFPWQLLIPFITNDTLTN